jgi:hypothetical protein
VLVVQEAPVDAHDLPGTLDVDVVGTVDHDLGDGLVAKERLDRPESREVVGHLLDEARAFVPGHDVSERVDDAVDDSFELEAGVGRTGGLTQRVEGADHLALEPHADPVQEFLPSLTRPGLRRGRWLDGNDRVRVRDLGSLVRAADPLEQRHDLHLPRVCVETPGWS